MQAWVRVPPGTPHTSQPGVNLLPRAGDLSSSGRQETRQIKIFTSQQRTMPIIEYFVSPELLLPLSINFDKEHGNK